MANILYSLSYFDMFRGAVLFRTRCISWTFFSCSSVHC